MKINYVKKNIKKYFLIYFFLKILIPKYLISADLSDFLDEKEVNKSKIKNLDNSEPEEILTKERMLENNIEPTEYKGSGGVYAIAWNDFMEPWKDFKDEGALLLNFLNSDILNLLKYFETEFKVTFITDDAIHPIAQGGKSLNGSKINFSSNTPLSRKQAWNIFITLLELAGVTLQPSSVARTYRVVPLLKDSHNGYTKGPLPLYIGIKPNELPDSDMRVRYVYIVKNTSMEAVKNIIKSMQSPASPDPIEILEIRGVLITDRIYNIKTIMAVIEEIDQLTTPETLAVIKLKKSDATKVVELYKSLIKEEGGSTNKMLGPKRSDTVSFFDPTVKLIPEPRTNSIIALGGAESIKKIEDFIFNYEDTVVKNPYLQTRRFQLKYTQAEAVARILQQAIDFKNDSEAGKFGSIRNGEKYFSNVSIIAEPTTNVLLITCPDEDYIHIYNILKDIDVEQLQVELDVVMMSIDLNKAKQLGAQIRNKDNGSLGKNINFQTSTLSPDGSLVTNYQKDSSGSTSGGPIRLLGNLLQLVTGNSTDAGTSVLSLGTDSYGVYALIKMLQNQTEAKIISNPFILATNNYSSSIVVGETRRIAATSITNSNNQQQSYTSDSAQISVKITPQINNDDMITLTINLENSQFTSPSGDSISAGNKITRSLNTSVLVKNKEMIALGGLTYDASSESEQRVPFLASIPIIGNLFKSKSIEKTRSVLVIFIEPKIVYESSGKEKAKKIFDSTKNLIYENDSTKNCPVQKLFFEKDSIYNTYKTEITSFLEEPNWQKNKEDFSKKKHKKGSVSK